MKNNYACMHFSCPCWKKRHLCKVSKAPARKKTSPCIVWRASANRAHDQKVMRYDLLVMKRVRIPALRTANY